MKFVRKFSEIAAAKPIIVKKPGFFRGSIVGFLSGFSLAGRTFNVTVVSGYVYFLQDYQRVSEDISAKLRVANLSSAKTKENARNIEYMYLIKAYNARTQAIEGNSRRQNRA
jgi:hypothetical protein